MSAAGRDASTGQSPSVGAARSFTTWWTEVYTRGLPDERRDRRRAEIASDLWEHERAALAASRSPAYLATEMLLRALRGMAADVTWRRTALRGRHGGAPVIERMLAMAGRLLIGTAMGLTALLGMYFVVHGVSIGFVEGGAGGETYPFYGIVEILSGLLLVGGVLAGARSPRIALGMVAVGVAVVGVTHVWALAINIPVGLALVALAFWRMRRVEARRVAAA